MTETLLALVPTYGVWLVLGSVILSCLALPVPSSMLVMAAGGFAAAEDLVLWQVIAAAFAGFVVGDQLSFGLGRLAGGPLVGWLSSRPGLGKTVTRARALIAERGTFAVFLSRTILSPLGPYVGYLGGALAMRWPAFTAAAVPAALVWSAAYAGLGYVFAARIAEVASILGSALGAILFAGAGIALIWWLIHSWRDASPRPSAASG